MLKQNDHRQQIELQVDKVKMSDMYYKKGVILSRIT